MNFVKNKTLYVLTADGNYEELADFAGELLVVKDTDIVTSGYSYEQYVAMIKNKLSTVVVGVYLLNDDESIHKDISEYVAGISLSMNYNQGETRNANVTLMNFKNEWSPSPVRDTLWKGTKFKIDIGLYNEGLLIWQPMGIYVLKNPTYDDEKRTVALELHDKYCLLDGSVGGKTMNTYKINVGTTVEDAIVNTLKEDRGDGVSIDYNTPFFYTDLATTKTPYTLTKAPNSSYGDLLADLCNMMACDMYYDEYGNFTVSDGVDNDGGTNKPIFWDFDEDDMMCTQPTIEIDFTSVVNWITVAGQIANGTQYSATVKNENPASQSNISLTIPQPLYIEDKNIVGNELCEARAKWELKKQSQVGVKLNFKSAFVPHLVPNGIVTYTNKRYGWYRENFLINSISFELTGESPSPIMSLSLSNANEVVFNGEIGK